MSHDTQPFEPDAHLDALLDEALSPESVAGPIPPGLTDKIIHATALPLQGQHTSIIARLGGSRRLHQMAAIIIFAAYAGIVMTVFNIFEGARDIVQFRTAFVALANYQNRVVSMGTQLQQMTNEIENDLADIETFEM